MAFAAFKLIKTWGTSPGTTADQSNKTAGYISTDANETPSAANAVAVPLLVSDPANYSYEINLRLELTTAPDTSVTALKIWGPDTQPGSDTKIYDYIGTNASYVTPVTTSSTRATDRIDTVRYSVGTALTIPGTLTAIGHKTDFIIMQRKVDFAAGKGTVVSQIMNFQYTES